MAENNPFDPPDPKTAQGGYAGDPLDPDEDFQTKFFRRLGDLGMPFVMRNVASDMGQQLDVAGGMKGAGSYLSPPTHYLPTEDQRGMTAPELQLQHDYLKSHGAYGQTYWDPSVLDTPMSRAAGSQDIPKAAARIHEEEERKKKLGPKVGS